MPPEYSIEEASKLLENDKFSLQEKYEICLKLKQFDRAKKYLLKIKELQNKNGKVFKQGEVK